MLLCLSTVCILKLVFWYLFFGLVRLCVPGNVTVSYSYWTKGGCQSVGPRGRSPWGPSDWHPPEVQYRRQAFSLPCHDGLWGLGSLKSSKFLIACHERLHLCSRVSLSCAIHTAEQYVFWILIALTSNFWTTGILLICQCHGQQNSLKAASKRGHWLHKNRAKLL